MSELKSDQFRKEWINLLPVSLVAESIRIQNTTEWNYPRDENAAFNRLIS